MNEFQKDKYRFSPIASLGVSGEDVIEKRRAQIINLIDELISYSVVVKDLVYDEIPYSIRNELLNIALYIIGEIELYEDFIEKKELPVSKICKSIIKPRKYIEEYKEYIITYLVILGNPRYKLIQDYLNVMEDKKNDQGSITVFPEDNNTRGIIFIKNKKSAIVINSMGEFKKIKIMEEKSVGEETEGHISKSLKDHKLQISILAVLIIITLAFGIYNYTKAVTTVVIDSPIPIKLEVNFIGKVARVNINQNTNAGSVNKNDILDRDIDTAIYRIIKFYNEKEMLTSNRVTVTISGKSIQYGTLKYTEEYVKEKSIDIRINNNGLEQKLY